MSPSTKTASPRKCFLPQIQLDLQHLETIRSERCHNFKEILRKTSKRRGVTILSKLRLKRLLNWLTVDVSDISIISDIFNNSNDAIDVNYRDGNKKYGLARGGGDKESQSGCGARISKLNSSQ